MNRFVGIAFAGLWMSLLPCVVASAETGRFQMERVEDGFVRLDTQTGAVSLCRMRDDQIVCRPSVDERYAFEDTIAVLEERIEKLEQLRTAPRPTQPQQTDDEVDRAMRMMEQMMRRFLGVIEEFEERMTDGNETTQNL